MWSLGVMVACGKLSQYTLRKASILLGEFALMFLYLPNSGKSASVIALLELYIEWHAVSMNILVKVMDTNLPLETKSAHLYLPRNHIVSSNSYYRVAYHVGSVLTVVHSTGG
jgi:hypothetical protein